MAPIHITGVSLATDRDDLVVTLTDAEGTAHHVIQEDWRSLPDGGQIYHSVTETGLAALLRGEAI